MLTPSSSSFLNLHSPNSSILLLLYSHPPVLHLITTCASSILPISIFSFAADLSCCQGNASLTSHYLLDHVIRLNQLELFLQLPMIYLSLLPPLLPSHYFLPRVSNQDRDRSLKIALISLASVSNSSVRYFHLFILFSL